MNLHDSAQQQRSRVSQHLRTHVLKQLHLPALADELRACAMSIALPAFCSSSLLLRSLSLTSCNVDCISTLSRCISPFSHSSAVTRRRVTSSSLCARLAMACPEASSARASAACCLASASAVSSVATAATSESRSAVTACTCRCSWSARSCAWRNDVCMQHAA